MPGQTSRILVNPHLKFIVELFNDYGCFLELTGGTVRDFILGKTPNNFNLVSSATLREIKNVLRDCLTVQVLTTSAEGRHGAVTVSVEGTIFEIAALRSDNRAKGLEIGSSKDWEMDASKSDFTMNSMFMGLNGRIDDYYAGQKDLKDGIIRFVGNPGDRIKEDYLRILRYFRFYCEYGKEHLISTIAAIATNLAGLQSIPGKRIWPELKKILTHVNAEQAIPLMMVELEMGKYMGFDCRIQRSLNEFNQVHAELSSRLSEVDPSTSLVSLIQSAEELNSIATRLEMSNFEKSNMLYIFGERKTTEYLSPRKMQVELESTPESSQETLKKCMIELLRYKGYKDIRRFLIKKPVTAWQWRDSESEQSKYTN